MFVLKYRCFNISFTNYINETFYFRIQIESRLINNLIIISVIKYPIMFNIK
jgi:hypothetical protein